MTQKELGSRFNRFNLEDMEKRCATIATLAELIIAKHEDFHGECDQLLSLLSEMEDGTSQELRVLTAFVSETDHYPTGEFKKLWNPAYLAGKAEELHDIEERYRESLVEACEKLVLRFKKTDRTSHV